MSTRDLRRQDLQALLSLTHDLGEIRSLEQFPRSVVAMISRLLPADTYGYTELNPCWSRTEGFVAPDDIFSPSDIETFEALCHEHPVIEHFRRAEDGQPRRISDFVSQRKYRDTGLYQDFYRKSDTEYQLAMQVPVPKPIIVGLVCNRQQRDFSERERQLLSLATLSLRETYQRLELDLKARALRVLLDLDETTRESGILLTTRSGVLLAANDQARAICQSWLDWLPRVDSLVEPLILQGFLRSAYGSDQAERVYRDDASPDGPSLRVRLITHRQDPDIVHLIRLTEEHPSSDQLRLSRLGLTPRQAEILLHLMQGHSNKRIALELSIADGTVKKHLEEIYRRLQVANRTAAVLAARRELESARR